MSEATTRVEENYTPTAPAVDGSNERQLFGSCVCDSCDKDGCTGI
ncbi:hypothetical protein [Halobaculum sp. MBLA0143]